MHTNPRVVGEPLDLRKPLQNYVSTSIGRRMTKNPTRCATNQEPGFGTLCQTEHIQSPHKGCLDSFYSIELVVGR